MGVREGQFLPEAEFLKSPSPSLVPRMERGGIRAHRELPSPISVRGQQVPGRGAAGGRVAAPALPHLPQQGNGEFIAQ